ncbi:GntR family transcriptional regulator [Actinoallomurus oryzae]|uniref:GntR family transcriptional regulator n=1 Tax=Actinoallomurus oryzae TaxID=502180 RepID=A0ABP8QVU4_9ACTN|nr:GntR family transcriptional regulator [Actinoallomurus sp. NBC_01490]
MSRPHLDQVVAKEGGNSVTDVAPLRTGLLSDQVYDRLRQAIIDGSLGPNTRLVESDLARRYGISQAPVRDAIRRLAHEGLVSHVQRRGSYVAEISAEDAARAREIRVVLEGIAARELAADWTPEAEQALTEEVERMRAAARSGSQSKLRQADLAFHRRLCALGGDTLVQRLWGVLEPSLNLLQVVGDPFYKGDLDELPEWHARLVTVLASGDAERAEAAVRDHAAGKSHGLIT